jgi:hypothetical protein
MTVRNDTAHNERNVRMPRSMIAVKYPNDIDARIRAISAELSRRTGGVPVAISSVMVQIATRGLDVYEAELGLTSCAGRAHTDKQPKSTKSKAA